MTANPLERRARSPGPRPGLRSWAARHPAAGFVVLAYGISWPLFVAARVGGGWPFVAAGAFGPAAAAAVITRWTGGSTRRWLRAMSRWRGPVRWYLFALGLPPLLVTVSVLAARALGRGAEIGSPATLVLGYSATLLLVAVLGGGQEEPGWRGYLLDQYQQRYPPLRATLLLGLVWGGWHLPVYGIGGLAGPVLLVAFYTYLYNRTASVPLCILLHAGFNTAIGYLDLADAGPTVNVTFLTTAAVAAATLFAGTRGRLGLDAARRE
jgi:membrane protease YdiL (CAAX protease family)